jgi:hypothetical protein
MPNGRRTNMLASIDGMPTSASGTMATVSAPKMSAKRVK